MMLECGCPGEYPDWHGQEVDLSHQAAHVLPITTFLHMPLSYETYRQMQQQEIDQLELQERWPGFTLTRTGVLRGEIIRLLDDSTSPSRHFKILDGNFRLHAYLHKGSVGTMRNSVREQQMALLDSGRLPKEIYLSYLTCPRCSKDRGGDCILLLRRIKTNDRLSRKISARTE